MANNQSMHFWQSSFNTLFQLLFQERTTKAVQAQTSMFEEAKLERVNWDRSNMGKAPILSAGQRAQLRATIDPWVQELRRLRQAASRKGLRVTKRVVEANISDDGVYVWFRIEPRGVGKVGWHEWYLIPDPGMEDDALSFYRRQWAAGIRPTRVEAA